MESNEKNPVTTINLPENAIRTLTVEEIYDKEKYDLSTVEIDDVFHFLNARYEGLTDDEANDRLAKFGYNQHHERKERSLISQFVLFLRNPLTYTMIFAGMIAIVIANGGSQPPEWKVFLGILSLFIINSVVGFYLQFHAKNKWKELNKQVEPIATVNRNNQWQSIPVKKLVPSDIIQIKRGDIIPADARLIVVNESVAIDQAVLTGETLFIKKAVGDDILMDTTCKRGDAEAIVIATGCYTFSGSMLWCTFEVPQKNRMEKFYSAMIKFSIISMVIFVITEILMMYAVYHYQYRRGINNILVLFIGSISIKISIETILSIIAAVGVKQFYEHQVIIVKNEAIEELAGATILYSDTRGLLTLDEPVIDKTNIKKYSHVEIDEILYYAALASLVKIPDAIDLCITSTYGDRKKIDDGIESLDFKSFYSVGKRIAVTYSILSDGSVHRVMKAMADTLLDLCTRNKTTDQSRQFHADVEELARKGLRSVAVAIEDVPNGDVESEGNGFQLIGLLPIFDPLRTDIKQTIDRARDLVKIMTDDQLTVAKETARQIGIGDRILSSKIVRDGLLLGSHDQTIDNLLLNADGFSGVYSEHKYRITEKLQDMGYIVAVTGADIDDVPTLAKANVGIAVADASDSARMAADIVLIESGLSAIIEAIHLGRQILERMKAYVIYACSITTAIWVAFSMLIFVFQFDFPPFMVLVLVFLNNSAMITISKDRVKPSVYPNNLNLFEILIYTIVYGICLALSTITLFSITVKTSFFSDKFGVIPFHTDSHPGWNHPQLHSIIYLQFSIISQALIFIIRSRRFFCFERPSMILIGAFALTQLVAILIAVYANWTFTDIEGCSWSWAGIVWLWSILWLFPLDLIKFPLRAYFHSKKKQQQQQRLVSGPIDQPLAEEQTDHHSALITT